MKDSQNFKNKTKRIPQHVVLTQLSLIKRFWELWITKATYYFKLNRAKEFKTTNWCSLHASFGKGTISAHKYSYLRSKSLINTIPSKLKVTQLEGLCELLSVQCMVKAAWEQVWLEIKTTRQIKFVHHMASSLCDTSTPEPDRVLRSSVVWGQGHERRGLGLGVKPACHLSDQLFVWGMWLDYWTVLYSKVRKRPSFEGLL